MADKCAGCTNKFKFFERPSVCPECHRSFCQSCLPYEGKKVKKSQLQVALEPCVYCKRQKAINKAQEAEILSNFQERYYDKAHIDRPIQSKLRLDKVVGQSPSPSTERKGGGVQLSEEDRALEERLKRLKESGKKAHIPSYTESEMREKLEKLRDEGKEGGNGEEGESDPPPTGDTTAGGSRNEEEQKPNFNTQTEQADRLMEQASDEVRIDERVTEARDEDLLRRFQQLKGDGNKATSISTTKQRAKVDFDVQELLKDMDDIPVLTDEDPDKLLRDLQAFQSKEEAAAMQALNSDGIQDVIDKAQKLAAEEQEGEEKSSSDPLSDIVYPKLPDVDVPMETESDGKEASNSEILKLLEEGKEELRLDQEQEREDSKFIQDASSRLDQLRGGGEEGGDHVTSHDVPDDEVVKSKPKSARIDFSWSHFGSESNTTATGFPPSSVSSAARQLGVLDDGEENGEEFDREVQGLIARMLEEAELDNRLEASGLNYSTEPEQKKSEPNRNDASHGATSLPPPPAPLASPHDATVGVATGPGRGGACGVDDLPWCCICNDDATIRCYDCDDDLYCQRCFSEGHQQFGLHDHQYAPFEPPPHK